jgi:hypothetical protein
MINLYFNHQRFARAIERLIETGSGISKTESSTIQGTKCLVIP